MHSIESLLDMILTEVLEEDVRARMEGLEPQEREIGPELPPIIYDEPILTEEDRAFLKTNYTKP